ncbi:MAG: 3-isopropylmalate dehydratase large subunit [Lachnospiraceae bacterium]|nr:3-isopropylmalate dehydratase large subunit [Lachnospiraceae bacterium]
MYVLAVLPILIIHKGLFFYYGDYNVQQVPFYILAHRAVREGSFFWNWNLDLGGPLIGDLAFYLTGSPFFWLTVPFPERVVPYLFPYLMALKYACGATFAFLYIRRFVRNENAARIGALLFAFSGFHACNIVFNHFTDAVCFFPLLLLTFDDLMATELYDDDGVRNMFRPWIRFTLVVTLLAVINYYFFFGMVIFLLLYGIARYVNRDTLHLLPQMLARALSGGLIGVMLAAFYLMMAFAGVAGNTRLGNTLAGYDLIVYPSTLMYFDILKSMVMTPDIIGRGTIFYTTTVKNASLAFYLPMFGIAGIFGFFRMRRGRRDWRKTLLIVCLLFAFIPVLNAAFSLFNAQYYARWYYMPVLVASLATAVLIDRGKREDLLKGVLVQTAVFLFMVLVFFLPSRNEEGTLLWMNVSENRDFFIADALVTAVITALLIITVAVIRHRKMMMRVLFGLTALACCAVTMNVLLKGKSLISNYGMEMWKKQMLDTRPLLPEDEGFYRIEADDTSTNYEMCWGYPTVHCFLSTVPAEIFRFYDGMAGISRTVESELPMGRPGLKSLLSVRYYVWNHDINGEGEFGKDEGTYGFEDIAYTGNGLTVYENKNYIPPGFTFGYYIKESDFREANKANNDRLLVKALVLSDEDALRYGHLMEELPEDQISRFMNDSDFDALCRERAESACTSFETTGSGFLATTADLPEESLVFFSVPATPGFTVTVDGEETEIITADYGMMAVCVPGGVHRIEARFVPQGIWFGLGISLLAVLCIICYAVYERRERRVMTVMSGMTMSQKILAHHAGLDLVTPGQLIEADVDLVLGNDITSPVAIGEMEKFSREGVFDKDKIALVLDHFVPAKDIKSAENCKCVRDFASAHDITHFYDAGDMGVEHALLPEKGLTRPGDLIVGADSHTCTYGALGAFSTGVGSTDMACAMSTGKLWFKVPSAIRFTLTGKPAEYVSGKDLILHIIGMIGVDGALYKSMEFTGEGIRHLNMDDRMTICNMAIEAGAKNGIFPVDEQTKAYLEEHAPGKRFTEYTADADATYDAEYTIDLSTLKPTVSYPHLPENARAIDQVGDIAIDQVVIGSCTNGRITDMRTAAKILSGKHVAKGVRCIVIPATQRIFSQCIEEGLMKTFVDAGCVVSTPTCGPCLGGYMGILAGGERCVSTTNRNFVGRMGAADSEIYLASPAVAAASAVAGKLTGP